MKNVSNKKTLLALIILVGVLIVGVGVLAFFYIKEKTKDNNTFSVENVDPSIANKLSGSITYSSDQSDSTSYYSPSLSLTFKYNSQLLTITEVTGAVSIVPKETSLFSSGYLKTAKTTDVKGLFLMNSLYSNIALSSNTDASGYSILLFTYTETSLLDATKSTTKYLTVFYKQLDSESSAYIQISDFNYTEETELTTALGGILSSISTDVSSVDKQLEADMSDGIVKVKFDRDLWSLSTQTSTYLNLSGVGTNTGSVSAYMSSVYSVDTVKDIDALKTQIDEKIATKQKYFDDNDLTFSKNGDTSEVTLGGVTFAKGSYTYDYGFGTSYNESIYVGYLSGSEQQIDITTVSYGDNMTTVEANIATVLNDIEITDQQVYSMNQEYVLGTSSVSINTASVLGQSATVHIYSKSCYDVSFSSGLEGFSVAGKTYSVCSAGLGSGFVIDDQGHIVSNAHVVDPNEFDAVVNGASSDGSLETALGIDFGTLMITQYGVTTYASLTSDQLDYYFLSFVSAMYSQGYMTITQKSSELYVQGDDVFDVDTSTGELINPSSHFKADLIGSNEISSSVLAAFSEDTSISDIADLGVIQLEDSVALPSLALADANALVGDTIYVVGYPGVADNSSIVDTASVLSSTVTRGTVSAIKPNASSTFDLIQVDASIDHGNSGGPIIDESGDVVAVATYGLGSSESGNYNAGISVVSLEDFLNTKGVTSSTNDARETLVSAMSDLSKNYYSRAKTKLSALITNAPTLSLVLSPYVELCDSKIAAGEDQTPWVDLGIDIPNWGLLLIGGLVLLFIGVGIFLVITLGKNKKKGTSDGSAVISTTTPESTPVVNEVAPTPVVSQQIVPPQVVVNEIPVVQPIPQQPVQNSVPTPPFVSDVQNIPEVTQQPVHSQATPESPTI